jgi:hypothetical protein
MLNGPTIVQLRKPAPASIADWKPQLVINTRHHRLASGSLQPHSASTGIKLQTGAAGPSRPAGTDTDVMRPCWATAHGRTRHTPKGGRRRRRRRPKESRQWDELLDLPRLQFLFLTMPPIPGDVAELMLKAKLPNSDNMESIRVCLRFGFAGESIGIVSRWSVPSSRLTRPAQTALACHQTVFKSVLSWLSLACPGTCRD